jgi:hypothetical protein
MKNTETIIENNLELLQDIHAKNYNGTNDAMIDNFETWVSGFSYDELELLVSKIPNWIEDSILDTLDEIKDRENEAPLQKLKRLTNYETTK